MESPKSIRHHTTDFHAPTMEKDIGFLFSNDGSTAHFHDGFAEFSLITSGEWAHTYEGTTHYLKKNSLIFLGINSTHSLLPNIPDSNHFTIFFKEDYLRESIAKFFPNKTSILTIKYKEITLPPDVFSFLLYEAHEMIESRASFHHEIAFQNFIHNLIYFMFCKQHTINEQIPKVSHKYAHALTLKNYLDNHLFLDEPMVSIYNMFPISPATLIKQFEEETGQTIVQYRNDKRMEYASLLLMEHKMTIINVANKVGISSPSHFAAEFKKKFGVSPKEFSKRHVI